MDIVEELGRLLSQVPNMTLIEAKGILAMLQTDENTEKMVEYLKTIDLTTTKKTPIILKAEEIIGKN